MNLRWKEERGSSLLLVVFIILIFTMLGVAIMGATLGGAQRSVTREKDVQSLHLAEMALNEAAAEVLDYLQHNPDMSIEELQTGLDEIERRLNALKEERTDSALDNSTSGYGEIDSIKVGKEAIDKEQNNVAYKEFVITLSAKADVDGVTRLLTQEIALNSFPDFLEYAMGSEGSVYLNGTPYIIGNLYAGDKLKIKNEAEYKYHTQSMSYERVAFPRVNGKVFVQPITNSNESSIDICDVALNTTCNNNYQPLDLSKSGYGAKLQQYLGVALDNLLVKDKNKFVAVNVKESFYDKLAEAAGIPRSSLVTKSGSTSDIIKSIDKRPSFTLLEEKAEDPNATPEEQADYTEYKNKLVQTLNGSLERSVIYRGIPIDAGKYAPLKIDGKPFSQLYYTPSVKDNQNPDGSTNWLIIDGDLIIDATNVADMQIRGNILVNGNLVIKGTVQMDATIFALGDSTIEDATIIGLENKELVLLSEGELRIHRVTAFNPITRPYTGAEAQDSGILKAFFYTDKKATLYGVGSVFWINGGLFAKGDIVVNAVLGYTHPQEDNPNVLHFDEMNDRDSPDWAWSRFIVQYNSNVYADQKIGLPRVEQIKMEVGPKRFADNVE